MQIREQYTQLDKPLQVHALNWREHLYDLFCIFIGVVDERVGDSYHHSVVALKVSIDLDLSTNHTLITVMV